MAKKKQKRAVKRKAKSKQPRGKPWLMGIIAAAVLIALVAIFINLDLGPGQAVYIGNEEWDNNPINLTLADSSSVRITNLAERQGFDFFLPMNASEPELNYILTIIPNDPFGYTINITNATDGEVARETLFTSMGQDSALLYLDLEDNITDLQVVYQNNEIIVRNIHPPFRPIVIAGVPTLDTTPDTTPPIPPSPDTTPDTTPSCTDSDGGNDIYERGILILPETQEAFEDVCLNVSVRPQDPGRLLKEYYCTQNDPNNLYDQSLQSCPDNSFCMNGACAFNGSESNLTVEVKTRGVGVNVENDSTRLRGIVLEEAAGEVEVWFEISDDKDDVEDGDGTVEEVRGVFNSGDEFSLVVEYLKLNKTYYYRACGKDQADSEHCGEIISFKIGKQDEGVVLKCRQTWSCRDWSDCLGGVETRTCSRIDECDEKLRTNDIGEIISVAKPSEQRACEGTVPTTTTPPTTTLTPVCQPNKQRCMGKQLQSCSLDGQSWQTKEICSGTCDSLTLSCRDGELIPPADKKGAIPAWLFPVLGALGFLIGIIAAVIVLQQRKKYAPAKEYVSKSRARGVSDQQIKSKLIGQGWDAEKVDSLLK